MTGHQLGWVGKVGSQMKKLQKYYGKAIREVIKNWLEKGSNFRVDACVVLWRGFFQGLCLLELAPRELP